VAGFFFEICHCFRVLANLAANTFELRERLVQFISNPGTLRRIVPCCEIGRESVDPTLERVGKDATSIHSIPRLRHPLTPVLLVVIARATLLSRPLVGRIAFYLVVGVLVGPGVRLGGGVGARITRAAGIPSQLTGRLSSSALAAHASCG